MTDRTFYRLLFAFATAFVVAMCLVPSQASSDSSIFRGGTDGYGPWFAPITDANRNNPPSFSAVGDGERGVVSDTSTPELTGSLNSGCFMLRRDADANGAFNGTKERFVRMTARQERVLRDVIKIAAKKKDDREQTRYADINYVSGYLAFVFYERPWLAHALGLTEDKGIPSANGTIGSVPLTLTLWQPDSAGFTDGAEIDFPNKSWAYLLLRSDNESRQYIEYLKKPERRGQPSGRSTTRYAKGTPEALTQADLDRFSNEGAADQVLSIQNRSVPNVDYNEVFLTIWSDEFFDREDGKFDDADARSDILNAWTQADDAKDHKMTTGFDGDEDGLELHEGGQKSGKGDAEWGPFVSVTKVGQEKEEKEAKDNQKIIWGPANQKLLDAKIIPNTRRQLATMITRYELAHKSNSTGKVPCSLDLPLNLDVSITSLFDNPAKFLNDVMFRIAGEPVEIAYNGVKPLAFRYTFFTAHTERGDTIFQVAGSCNRPSGPRILNGKPNPEWTNYRDTCYQGQNLGFSRENLQSKNQAKSVWIQLAIFLRWLLSATYFAVLFVAATVYMVRGSSSTNLNVLQLIPRLALSVLILFFGPYLIGAGVTMSNLISSALFSGGGLVSTDYGTPFTEMTRLLDALPRGMAVEDSAARWVQLLALVVVVVAMLFMLVLSIMRQVIFVILIVLMPIACFMLLFKRGQAHFSTWAKAMVAVIVLPVMLALTFSIGIQLANVMSNSLGDNSSTNIIEALLAPLTIAFTLLFMVKLPGMLKKWIGTNSVSNALAFNGAEAGAAGLRASALGLRTAAIPLAAAHPALGAAAVGGASILGGAGRGVGSMGNNPQLLGGGGHGRRMGSHGMNPVAGAIAQRIGRPNGNSTADDVAGELSGPSAPDALSGAPETPVGLPSGGAPSVSGRAPLPPLPGPSDGMPQLAVVEGRATAAAVARARQDRDAAADHMRQIRARAGADGLPERGRAAALSGSGLILPGDEGFAQQLALGQTAIDGAGARLGATRRVASLGVNGDDLKQVARHAHANDVAGVRSRGLDAVRPEGSAQRQEKLNYAQGVQQVARNVAAGAPAHEGLSEEQVTALHPARSAAYDAQATKAATEKAPRPDEAWSSSDR